MMTMDGSLRQLWSEGVISADTAITYSQDSERMKNMVR